MDNLTHSTAQDQWRKLVFISYAEPDRATTEAVVAKLEEAGIPCWVAYRDVPPGANYGGVIIEAIQTSELTVLLLSSHSNASPFVAAEIERAVNYRKPIIPVRLEDVAPSLDIELHVAAKQWVDLAKIGPEGLARRLLVRLGSLVKSATPQETVDAAATLGREAAARDEEVRRIQEQEVLRQQEAAWKQERERLQQEALRQQAAEKEEQERGSREAAEKADQARRSREAAEKAEQARRSREAAEKAEQARRSREAAEKAEQARRSRETAEKTEQARRRQQEAFTQQATEEHARQSQQEAIRQQTAAKAKTERLWLKLAEFFLGMVFIAPLAICIYAGVQFLFNYDSTFGYGSGKVSIIAFVATAVISSLGGGGKAKISGKSKPSA